MIRNAAYFLGLICFTLSCSGDRTRGGGGGFTTGVDAGDTGITPTDTGIPPTDTGFPPTDTGFPPTDTGFPPTDTGFPPTDTGFPPPTDTGVPPPVTGLPPLDSGIPPPDSGVPPPPDSGIPTGDPIGAPCTNGGQCADGTCLNGTIAWWSAPFNNGYCTKLNCDNQSNPCPTGSDCYIIDEQDNTACLADCTGPSQCRTPDYTCYDPGACLPDTGSTPGTSPVGGPCVGDGDCANSGSCIEETSTNGFVGGYCVIFNCDAQTSPCPSGAECFIVDSNNTTACLDACTGPGQCRSGYACVQAGACMPSCTPGSCDPGYVCNTDGICEVAPCTPGSCDPGLICDSASGQCVVDIGNPPPGPAPTVTGPALCTGGESHCGALVPFEPDLGTGYWDYPLNGETQTDQYRSYLRRDLMMLVKHSAALVEGLAVNWAFGNHEPIGLGDMSEANGDIPGTRDGSPGHPVGTHTNGRDIDIAYYQLSASDNRLRAICDHYSGGQEQYHCVSPPTDFDVWRTALFLGLMHDSPQLRVIGVDGQVGPLIDSAISQLCASGYLNNSSCTSSAITYEVTDAGRGWFRFHHHHFHMSITDTNGNSEMPNYRGRNACIRGDCSPATWPMQNITTKKKIPLIDPVRP